MRSSLSWQRLFECLDFFFYVCSILWINQLTIFSSLFLCLTAAGTGTNLKQTKLCLVWKLLSMRNCTQQSWREVRKWGKGNVRPIELHVKLRASKHAIPILLRYWRSFIYLVSIVCKDGLSSKIYGNNEFSNMQVLFNLYDCHVSNLVSLCFKNLFFKSNKSRFLFLFIGDL